MKIRKATCPSCKNVFEGKSKLSLLGFPKFVCPQCNNKFIYPLGYVYIYLYWFFLIVFIIATAVSISEGQFLIPGLVVIIAMVGLIKDYFLKKKLRALGVDYRIK